jgi:hypothetical protein
MVWISWALILYACIASLVDWWKRQRAWRAIKAEARRLGVSEVLFQTEKQQQEAEQLVSDEEEGGEW